MTGLLSQPIDAGPGARLVGYDEFGRPVYQGILGTSVYGEGLAAQPSRPNQDGWDMVAAAQSGGYWQPDTREDWGTPGQALNQVIGLLAEGALNGITAPGRAAQGRPVTMGDVWDTALDWGVLSAPMTAPPGALRAGAIATDAAETPAEVIARMLREGRADEITDDMMAALTPNDNMELARLYESGATGMDMPLDEPSRMARAEQMGFGGNWLHGTTHDFSAFGGSTGNIEGHFGAGHYFTDNARDASRNYAGFGPDLTQRIEIRAEKLADELGLDYNDPAVIAQARAEIAGQHQGAIIPTMTRGNAVSVMPYTRGEPTILENRFQYSSDDFLDDAANQLGPDADRFEIRSLAGEMAWEANMGVVPEGPLADFQNSIIRQGDEYGFDGYEALEPIQESILNGHASANELDGSLRRGPLMYAESPDGQLVGNEVIRQAFQDAGYPNIEMSANSQGWNMEIPDGTNHLIASDPRNIRSRFARFDPRLRHLAHLSAGIGGLAFLPGLLSERDANGA